jgi:ferredoxin--NADP+ reductase
MAYAITQSCCSDASCVSVCPVNCIHPTPEEREFAGAEMLHIDPAVCIDCGACADACPVDAILPVDRLIGPQAVYEDVNRAWFEDRPTAGGWDAPAFPTPLRVDPARLRVAVVGTGPSASYTAQLLLTAGARVSMLDRLDVPGGLVRFGVAPDHVATQGIGDRFATVHQHPRLQLHLGVEVGTHVAHAELLAHHDAVVYAVGASADRALQVPGEDLSGSLPARTFVGWYNGHPEVAPDAVEVRTPRVVVVGTGNVALDMARLLLGDPRDLDGTRLAAHARAALATSGVREVVLLGRRGPEEAAWSRSELRALLAREDLDVVVDGDDDLRRLVASAPDGSKAALLRDVPVGPVDLAAAPTGDRRRLVLRFHTRVARLEGDPSVGAVHLEPAGGGTAARIPTGLVLRSVGYRGSPVRDLPFDLATGTVPHDAGRVVDPTTGRPVAGSYVVGWIKRGPSGGIGSNRADAAETVATLLGDADRGLLAPPHAGAGSFRRLVRRRRSTGVPSTGQPAVGSAAPPG